MKKTVVPVLVAVFLVTCVLAALPAITYIAYFRQHSLSDDPAQWGQLGDYIGGILNPVFAVLNLLAIIYLALEIHDRDRGRDAEKMKVERRHRAVEQLNQFLTDEYFIKSRLIIQEYLLPSGSKFNLSVGNDPTTGRSRLLDFNELTIHLGAQDNPEDREARFHIRAIPSFFWLIDQSMRKEYIAKDETLFNFHYCWYWTYIIRFRIQRCKDNRLFQCLPWMLSANELAESEQEYKKYLDDLSVHDPKHRVDWEELSQSAEVKPP